MSVTIVTCLIDIGRGGWNDNYKRSYNEYLCHLSKWISVMDENLVIYIESKSIDVVKSLRRGKNTIIKEISLETLPTYKYYDKLREIQSSREFKNGQVSDGNPLYNPLYNLIVHNKPYLLREVTDENPFNSEYFVWLDAGYGHSGINFPINFYPKTLMEGNKEKITLLQLEPISINDKNTNYLFKVHPTRFGGGFIGGHKEAIKWLSDQYDSLLQYCFLQKIIDQDQTLLLILFLEFKDRFNVKYSHHDWFGAIRIFNDNDRYKSFRVFKCRNYLVYLDVTKDDYISRLNGTYKSDIIEKIIECETVVDSSPERGDIALFIAIKYPKTTVYAITENPLWLLNSIAMNTFVTPFKGDNIKIISRIEDIPKYVLDKAQIF